MSVYHKKIESGQVGEAALALADTATDAEESALVLNLCQLARRRSSFSELAWGRSSFLSWPGDAALF
jgi:hypothetical protein